MEFQFSASADLKREVAEMKSGKYVRIISSAQCQRYRSNIDLARPPPFDPGFIEWANKLADSSARRRCFTIHKILRNSLLLRRHIWSKVHSKPQDKSSRSREIKKGINECGSPGELLGSIQCRWWIVHG